MGFKSSNRVEALLNELCVRYGYCLSPNETAAVIADPPRDVEGFVDAVPVAEGHDLPSFDKGQRRVVTAVVRKWIDDEHSGETL